MASRCAQAAAETAGWANAAAKAGNHPGVGTPRGAVAAAQPADTAPATAARAGGEATTRARAAAQMRTSGAMARRVA